MCDVCKQDTSPERMALSSRDRGLGHTTTVPSPRSRKPGWKPQWRWVSGCGSLDVVYTCVCVCVCVGWWGGGCECVWCVCGVVWCGVAWCVCVWVCVCVVCVWCVRGVCVCVCVCVCGCVWGCGVLVGLCG